MESNSDVQEALTQAERAGAAPYIDYPPTPRWYPPAVGAWAGAMVVAMSGVSGRRALYVPLLIALLLVEVGFFAWYRRYRGTMPSMRQVPAEIAGAMRLFAAVVAGTLLAIAAVYSLVGPIASAIVAFVLVAAGVQWYEVRYAAAAKATRQRLA